jgi:hypothetical protein
MFNGLNCFVLGNGYHSQHDRVRMLQIPNKRLFAENVRIARTERKTKTRPSHSFDEPVNGWQLTTIRFDRISLHFHVF